MAKKEKVTYYCDRCKNRMNYVYRDLKFTWDISDLWDPRTWLNTAEKKYDLCEDCFKDFLKWIHTR